MKYNIVILLKKTELIVRSFLLKDKRIIANEELEKLCKKYCLNFKSTKKLLLNKKYLVTIFRGIFYLKDFNEKTTNVLKYSPFELLSIGLKLKGVKWYFGLNTSLKFLNLTHEVFAVNYVINNRFNRVKPMKICGENFKFIKIKPELFFGIKRKKASPGVFINYSDMEKTILDMIYLRKSASVLSEFKNKLRIKKMRKYSKFYPKSVQRLVK